jgi:hypothetical protein
MLNSQLEPPHAYWLPRARRAHAECLDGFERFILHGVVNFAQTPICQRTKIIPEDREVAPAAACGYLHARHHPQSDHDAFIDDSLDVEESRRCAEAGRTTLARDAGA